MADPEIDLLRSSLDLLILKALNWGPRHGYGVAEWIEFATSDALQVGEGTLYPALHRLEQRGWVASEWGVSDNARRAKFYRLTAAGKRQLAASHSYWARFAGAVTKVLETAPASG